MFKKVLFTVFSICLCVFTADLLGDLYRARETPFNWSESFFVAFLINLFITGIFAFPGFVFPTSRFLPERYYTIKNRSFVKKVYASLKVNWFRKILMATFWGRTKNRKKFFNGKRSGLEDLIFQTKQAEFGHVVPLIIITAVAVCSLVIDKEKLAMLTVLTNVVGNFYPVILQRWTRSRLVHLIDS